MLRSILAAALAVSLAGAATAQDHADHSAPQPPRSLPPAWNAAAAAEFAMCAAKADKFWPVHDLLFQYQSQLWELCY